MDLPTCPACKQSVLDDDAVDCPFCGAPLKGGAAPARPAPAAKVAAGKSSERSAPSERPTASKIGPAAAVPGKSAPGSSRSSRPVEEEAPAAPADDDPFGIDPAAAANAIPVNRQQSPGKTIEVTCPMCETKGFISPKASGKQVKCCNPQCMVPLFTAPALEKKAVVAPPPPPKKKIPWLYIGGGVAFAAIAGVSIWFMQDHGPTELPPLAPVVTGSSTSATEGMSDPDKNQKAEAVAVEPDASQNPDAARQAIIKQGLARMIEVSTNIPPQRKPMWRRLAVTAYIYSDDLKEARKQLDLLEGGTKQSSWEGIPPLVNLAWLKDKSPEEFKKAVDESFGLAEKLPVRGRFATEASISLAPLLVISGKTDAARALLAKHHSDPPLEQLAAAVRIVIQDRSFNLDTTLTGRAVGPWQSPMETAVTLVLAAHGRWDDALAWASQTSDVVGRTEATTVWAESFLRDAVPAGDATGLERAVAAGKDFSADGKARLLARLAAVRFAQGDRAAAGELLKQAQSAMDSVVPPPPVIVEGAKPLLDLKLASASRLTQQALSAAEIAGIQAQSADARAWDNILLAMRYLSAIGPTMTPTQERRRQVDRDSGRVGTELNRALGLKKEDEKRRALVRYKEKLRDVEKAAAARFQAEVVVLEAAVRFGFPEQVWDLLQSLDRKGPQEHQPLIATAISLQVANAFAGAGQNPKSEQINAAVESRIDLADPEVVKVLAERELMAGNLAGCTDRLNAAITPNGHLHEWVLRLADRLVMSGKIQESIAFCSRIKDPTLREESLYLIAALAGRQGKWQEFWKLAKDQGLGAMESSAVCAGVIVGMKSS